MVLRNLVGCFRAAASAAMAALQSSSDLMMWSYGTARRNEFSPSDAVSALLRSPIRIDLCLMNLMSKALSHRELSPLIALNEEMLLPESEGFFLCCSALHLVCRWLKGNDGAIRQACLGISEDVFICKKNLSSCRRWLLAIRNHCMFVLHRVVKS